MKNKFFFKTLPLATIFALTLVSTGVEAKSGKIVIDIAQIKTLYKQHQYSAALQKVSAYIRLYPNDPDGYFFAGLIHKQQGNYEAAQRDFTTALRLHPNYPEARELLFSSYLGANDYDGAIQVAEIGIQNAKNPQDWQYKKATVYYAQRDYYYTLKNLKPLINTHPQAYKLYDQINRDTGYQYIPHFEAGISANSMPVNRPQDTWLYNSAYASFVNRHGQYGLEVRQAQRLGNNGNQYVAFAWPKIADFLYLHLLYGHSDQPALFANNDYLAEAYFTLPHGIDIFGGGEYRQIAQTNLSSYFIGIGKYFFDNYYFSFSPIFFQPRAGEDSVLYRFKFRRYFLSPDKYVGIVFGTGQSPDLADLLTVSFFKTNYTYVMLEGGTPIDKRFLFTGGIGYSWQKFPQGFTRRMAIINVGLKFRAVR